MEESSALCVDPEEDEIFFYGITEKEAELKGLMGNKSVPTEKDAHKGHRSEENNQISEISGFDLGSAHHENDLQSLNKVEQMLDSNLPVNGLIMSAVAAEGSLKICKNAVEEPTVFSDELKTTEKIEPNENEEKEIKFSNISIQEEKNGEHDLHENMNIHVDHNYSTPVKTVIDKSILKTPKSVVKADKDGGFLKVLSEIALVKAEVDENTHNDVSAFSVNSCKKETTNDGNKENEKADQQTINSKVKSREATPMKLFKDPFVENLNEQFSKNLGMLNESNIENTKNSEEQNLENENVNCDTIFDSNIVTNTRGECCELECAPSGKENSDDLNDIQVIFEKLTTNMEKPIDEFKTEKQIDVSNLIKLDSFIEKASNEDPKSNEKQVKNPVNEDVGRKEFQIPQINILDESLPVVSEQDVLECFPRNGMNTEDECHKKYLRRRTMMLLGELSEIVSHGLVNKDSEGDGKIALSEEAAKVIQKLKAVGIDDSINSSDQYFNLDNINETFLSSEVSDILNDTLSKPLGLLTNKDVELLLEKVSSTTLEEKFKSPSQTQIAEILDAEKENVCQNKENLAKKIENPKNEKTPGKLVNSGKFQKTPVSLKNNIPSAQVKTQQRYTPNNKCVSENKKTNPKPLIQSQVNQNGIRGCQTAEKAAKGNVDTRIPKLTSTTSKIPVKGSRDGRIQCRNPTPNKASKSLKFDNIESPVQAYINAKTPVLISNVKGKPESKFNAWPKQTTSSTKIGAPEKENKLLRSEPKSNLPYVKYRSAIPLKLEKAPESRLPRLAPKMQKLILGNSPVIAKHEGRIHLTATTEPQIMMNDSSIMLKPNEVSVIVRKVALQTNVNK